MSFENKVVIVTGASRGIGRATALAFGERKARVVVNYCANEQPAREVAELIEQNGGIVTGSVSQNTDYLLCGADPGSKLDKAKKLGTTVLDEDAFEKLLK